MASHIALGKKGELIAQEHLRQHQYNILAVNWRSRHREIDIIASISGCLVFFEIKTLADNQFGWPEQHVNYGKRKNLLAAAAVYMDQMKELPAEVRFDVISITFTKGEEYELVHFEDAF